MCVRCAWLQRSQHIWSSSLCSSKHPEVCCGANTECSLTCLRCSGLSSAGPQLTPLLSSSCSDPSPCLLPSQPESCSWSNRVCRETSVNIQGSWRPSAPHPSSPRCSPGRSCVHRGWWWDSWEGLCRLDKRGDLCWQECEALPCLCWGRKGALCYTSTVSFSAKMTQRCVTIGLLQSGRGCDWNIWMSLIFSKQRRDLLAIYDSWRQQWWIKYSSTLLCKIQINRQKCSLVKVPHKHF